MIWIDMEMTGLFPEKHHIIEMATIVTDKDLSILAEGPHIAIYQPPKILADMDSWNRKQHGKSGLIDLIQESKIGLAKAEDLTLQFLKKYCYFHESPLCGNAVHHDRRFIKKYMHRLDRFLHYRHVDVSTVKILVKNWYPKIKKRHSKKDAHRALDDIRESIEELKFYRKHYFV